MQHHTPQLENESLSALLSDLPNYLVHARTDNTVKAYSSGFNTWKKWADTYSVEHLPANPLSFALYMLSLIQGDQNITKIRNIYYAVKFYHNTLHFPDPTSNEVVQEMLEVAKRLCKKKINKKNPITIEHVKQLLESFSSGGTISLQDLRTFVMILLGFSGFLRYDELSNIRFGDFIFHDTYFNTFIEESKTDVYRDGKWVTISGSGSELCPLRNLREYLERADIRGDNLSQFIFRGIVKTKNGERLRKKNKPLSYTRAREIILKSITSIGLNERLFGTHSLRAGGATTAANAGVPDRLFKRHGRWLSDKAKDMYVEDDLEHLLSVTKAMGL